MINSRFQSYFQEHFFSGNDTEWQAFIQSLTAPIDRTIRIRPGEESGVISRLQWDGWILTPTPISRVYRVTRGSHFSPHERRLGMSLDHLVGNFYIQELAAAHPVDILADSKIHTDPFLILDMASSPWGKTTQLAEYFPNAHIIANEPGRERIPQLLQNLERMNTPQVSVTLYPGQYWRHAHEAFDRILLDAPCSGEGTLYKGTDALKHWHIKSIRRISTLQKRLIESAIHALKPGGEMVYSTCALNDIENEEVVAHLQNKYPHIFSVTYQKKFWPHIDGTGWFFVTKIVKHQSIPEIPTDTIRIDCNTEIQKYHRRIPDWNLREEYTLYKHRNKILSVQWSDTLWSIWSNIFIMRMWEYIWDISWDTFIPRARAFRHILPKVYGIHTIRDEHELDQYLRGSEIPSPWTDEYVLIQYQEVPISIEYRNNHILSNRFPREWQRGK